MPQPPESPLRQVLKGLALNREPGWNFPGNFLELSFDEVGPDSARLSIDPGPHCVDHDGQMNLGAVSVLADIGMAASMRQEIGLPTRMATVAMSLQFTGAPRVGRLHAIGRFDGFFEGAKGQQGLTRGEIRAGDVLVATASGSFMALGNREGTAPLPMRRRGVQAEVAPLNISELNEEELAVYERARRAMEPGVEASFIERFWDFTPRRNDDPTRGSLGARPTRGSLGARPTRGSLGARPTRGSLGARGATNEFANGLHVGNRVGHTQGGLTFALAAATASGALEPEWHLVGISAWYVSPGTGATLRAEASVVHQGSLTAVVRTRVADPEGRTVLEAVTNHSRAGPHGASRGAARP